MKLLYAYLMRQTPQSMFTSTEIQLVESWDILKAWRDYFPLNDWLDNAINNPDKSKRSGTGERHTIDVVEDWPILKFFREYFPLNDWLFNTKTGAI